MPTVSDSDALAFARYLGILARIERRLDEEREAAENAEERVPPTE